MNTNEKDCYSFAEAITESEVRLDVKAVLLSKHEDLAQQIKEIDESISRLHQEYSLKIEQLQMRKKPLEEALHHVEALLKFEDYCLNGKNLVGNSQSQVASVSEVSITDAAFDLLKRLHQPLHYKDISLKLQERGIYIPGKDAAATLLSRLTRDGRFKRTEKRGVYALSTWRMIRAKRKVSKTQQEKR